MAGSVAAGWFCAVAGGCGRPGFEPDEQGGRPDHVLQVSQASLFVVTDLVLEDQPLACPSSSAGWRSRYGLGSGHDGWLVADRSARCSGQAISSAAASRCRVTVIVSWLRLARSFVPVITGDSQIMRAPR